MQLVCEYFAHVECQDFAVPDCKENATYVPGKDLSSFKHQVSARLNNKIMRYVINRLVKNHIQVLFLKNRKIKTIIYQNNLFLQHHWREGNLPQTSKCAYCKKTCWSSECLTGLFFILFVKIFCVYS